MRLFAHLTLTLLINLLLFSKVYCFRVKMKRLNLWSPTVRAMHAQSIINTAARHTRILGPASQMCRLSSSVITSGNSESKFTEQDELFMKLALRHAQHAFRDKEVPVGAVIVDSKGEVLAASRNRVESTKDATAHAEVICMREAAALRDEWRLDDCTIYTTLEPCVMCLSAMQAFRVRRLVYGANDIRLGACGSFIDLAQKRHPFHTVEVVGGLFAENSETLMKRFFQNRREEAQV